jgi:hypothetical protein
LTRFCERQADSFAAALTSPERFTDTMTLLKDFLPAPPTWLPSWTLTHPEFDERIANVRDNAANPTDLARAAGILRGFLIGLGIALCLMAWKPAAQVWSLSRIEHRLQSNKPHEAARLWHALDEGLKGHPQARRLAARTALDLGQVGHVIRWASAEAWNEKERSPEILKVLEHSTAPEIAFHLEIVEFLLQALDLRRVHGVSLFDEALYHIQTAFGQR